eukprot:GSChrysophyteH1.ASY1.ANO1.2919.1 assembled CDS
MSEISKTCKRVCRDHPVAVGLTIAGVVAFVSYKLNQLRKKGDITVSAPGKALIAGGYLVLEHPNVGLVVSCSSRFYSTIRPIAIPEIAESNPNLANKVMNNTSIVISVVSPQFRSQQCYIYDWAAGSVIFMFLTAKGNFATNGKNTAPFYSKLVELKDNNQGLAIKLRAHNDFYSQIATLQENGLPLFSSSLKSIPNFKACPVDAKTGEVVVAKTGMGSSAALTTSLVGSLLKYFHAIELLGPGNTGYQEEKRILHNLSQLAHAVAQGKIGSGFDVSAAVYGSQLYRRFSPTGFSECMDAVLNQNNQGNNLNNSRLVYNSVTNNQLWSGCEAREFGLPNGFNIMMGDVAGGSSSTSMAKAVLSWKASGGKTAEKIWFQVLSAYETNYPDIYNMIIDTISELDSAKWYRDYFQAKRNELPTQHQSHMDIFHRIISVILEIKSLFKLTRQYLKKMGEEAGVGIEPDSQTKLCDATETIPGVMCAGVPGAGGVDAIYAVTLSAAARLRVEQMWSTWHHSPDAISPEGHKSTVCPLILRAETDTSSSGVQVENLAF